MLMHMGKAQVFSVLHKEPQQLKNAESGKNCLPQGGEHQLVIQYQMASLENIHSVLL